MTFQSTSLHSLIGCELLVSLYWTSIATFSWWASEENEKRNKPIHRAAFRVDMFNPQKTLRYHDLSGTIYVAKSCYYVANWMINMISIPWLFVVIVLLCLFWLIFNIWLFCFASGSGEPQLRISLSLRIACADKLTLLTYHPLTLTSVTPQAANQDGAGPHSELVTCRTPAAAPGVVPALFLQEHPTGADGDLHPPYTCLPLVWEEPCCNGAPITSYCVVMGDESLDVGNATRYVVTGLQPNTEYRCVEFGGGLAVAKDALHHHPLLPLQP